MSWTCNLRSEVSVEVESFENAPNYFNYSIDNTTTVVLQYTSEICCLVASQEEEMEQSTTLTTETMLSPYNIMVHGLILSHY